jgi:predicted alpha/beta-hydrolase family hydrolase
MTKRRIKIIINEAIGEVSAIFNKAKNSTKLVIIGHGAGAGMDHPFMEALAQAFYNKNISTLRYQFPYMEKGKRAPDRPPKCHATIRSVIAKTIELAPDHKIYLSGKSFGGRMASQVAAEDIDKQIKGLIYFGFPLHAPGRDSLDRAAHLPAIKIKQLFLQGKRDKLANIELMKTLDKSLKKTKMVFYEWADHSFKVPKKSGTTQDEIILDFIIQFKKWAK